MGRRVPEGVLALGVVPFEKLYRGILIHGAGDVPFLTVHLGGKHIGRKPGADALGYLERGDAALKLLHRAIRKFDIYHIHCI